MQSSPQDSYIHASSNETSPLSNEDIIAQKILKRAEIAKMTRQLKEKLLRVGLKVRDQNSISGNDDNNAHPHQLNSSTSSTPMSSPSKSLSEDVANDITATAISNIQNSKLLTPTKSRLSLDGNNISLSSLTPATISPLKRKRSMMYRTNSHYEQHDDTLVSPLKRSNTTGMLNSSPFDMTSSPYQFTRGSLLVTPQSLPHSSTNNATQPPKTPPLKQFDIFQTVQRSSEIKLVTKSNTLKPSNEFQNENSRRMSPKKKLLPPLQQDPDLNRTIQADQPWDENTPSLQMNPDKEQSTNSLLSTPRASTSKNNQDDGADLLLFLSNSPARTFNNKEQRDINKMLAIPTTPKANNSNHNIISIGGSGLESTPLRNGFLSPTQNSMMQPLLGTPIGINLLSNNNNNNQHGRFQAPATPNNRLSSNSHKNVNRTPGFSMSDYINFTPSPRVARTPDYYQHSYNIYTKNLMNVSKDLNNITNIKEDEEL
ncbi:unnamed protein product [Pichia kudriavzevii]